MKIADYRITMASDRIFVKKSEKTESLRMWIDNRMPDSVARNQDIINDIKISIGAEKASAIKKPNLNEISDTKLTPKEKLMIAIIEMFTGKKIKIIKLNFTDTNEIVIPDKNQLPQDLSSQRVGWGIEYDLKESYDEAEHMTFSAEGIIKTEDGKELKFSVSVTMSREFMTKNDIRLRLGDAKIIDPLVINFPGTASQLTDKKFGFDLDSDGTEDKISFPINGGFLVLDKNKDGKINNGKELFGPSSGNGFAELAEYDTDYNGWIDESDIVFNDLKIWTKDTDGNDIFYTLKDKNISAIYLGNIYAEFDIKNHKNMLYGKAKRASVLIREDGSAGTIQQIDLTV
jgi:hypothetical protein